MALSSNYSGGYWRAFLSRCMQICTAALLLLASLTSPLPSRRPFPGNFCTYLS